MSTRTTSLRHCGVPMTVTYRHSKARAATLEEPSEEASLSIYSIRIGGVECHTLFGEPEMEDLEMAITEEMEAADDEHADMQHREARSGSAQC